MKQVVCAVFDSAAGVYGRPIFVASRGVALRSFTDEVNRRTPENPMSEHPEDFSLFLLAEFDDNSGEFFSAGSECLVRGKDVIRAPQ